MAVAVGVFDLFTYGIPRALHLSLIAYVLFRLQLVHPSVVFGAPSALLLVGGAVLSYVLGHLTYPLRALLEKIAPRWNYDVETARREFVARVPEARERPFALLLLIGLVGAIKEGRGAQHVDRLKTLEICFWLPGIDDKFNDARQ
ncbi:hypothetical protein K378_03616 [Streptomyces sp. Amel2xB2]|uniref:hypothetical protein n=1 Tax=Streptomyces sp. Amel2xB2 TaxID=1305829 RepID=UPI000DBAA3C9|nr:hypothetical protein [Streptomyces sp. Amel2xB2]RAJ63501.1 hypothetical protein K378_03616 [Streptomyces sp. Amel2xB2]